MQKVDDLFGELQGKSKDGSLEIVPDVKIDTSTKESLESALKGMGSSYASGNWGVKKNETALVGELGRETLVRNGKYITLGDNGAEFVNLRAGDIIFNHKQSEELFKYGHVTSGGGRARVVGQNYANGTAYSAGTWTMGNVGNGNVKGSGSSTKKATSKKSNTSKAKSSSGSNTKSNSNPDSSDSAEKSEELLDWIETLLSRTSRLTELATSAVDRAVGYNIYFIILEIYVIISKR